MNMFVLAYGEFDSTSYWEMLGETLPFFVRCVVPPAFLYVVSSALAEQFRARIVGLGLYTLILFLMLPTFVVLGAWGPAHVAMDIGFWAWPAFWLLLLVKTARLYRCGTVTGSAAAADSDRGSNGLLASDDRAGGQDA